MYFFDSSAFVKLFVAELGSTQMIALAEGVEDRLKAASALTALEVRSAIRRRERMGEITAAHADAAANALDHESRHYVEHPLSTAVISAAAELIEAYPLRALDALQLATAVMIRNSLPPGRTLTFVCCDERLSQAAASQRLITFDPNSASA